MAIIKKKIWLGYFDDLVSGKKTFDLRLNDFDVAVGDTLVLEEWDPQAETCTGRSIEKTVTYILRGKIDELFWTKEEILEKGIQILSLK